MIHAINSIIFVKSGPWHHIFRFLRNSLYPRAFFPDEEEKILLRICNPPPEFPHGLPRAFFAHTIFSLPGVMDSCIMAFRSTPAYDTHDFKKENSLVSWSFELFCLSCRDFRRFLAEQEWFFSRGMEFQPYLDKSGKRTNSYRSEFHSPSKPGTFHLPRAFPQFTPYWLA